MLENIFDFILVYTSQDDFILVYISIKKNNVRPQQMGLDVICTKCYISIEPGLYLKHGSQVYQVIILVKT